MLGNADNIVTTLLDCDVRAASVNGPDVSVKDYKGYGQVILTADAQGSGVTSTVKLQHSAAAIRGEYFTTDGDADAPLNKSTSGKTKLAVTFTPAVSSSIKTVKLALKRTGTITSDKVLSVTLEADSTGAPSGSALGTAATVLAQGGVGTTYDWIEFTFATPVDVTAESVYWIVLTSNYSASDSNFVSWSALTVSDGGTGAVYASPDWTAVTTQKNLFFTDVYVFSDVTGGAFSAVGNTTGGANNMQTRTLDLDHLKNYVRCVDTVAGGSATGATGLVVIGKQ